MESKPSCLFCSIFCLTSSSSSSSSSSRDHFFPGFGRLARSTLACSTACFFLSERHISTFSLRFCISRSRVLCSSSFARIAAAAASSLNSLSDLTGSFFSSTKAAFLSGDFGAFLSTLWPCLLDLSWSFSLDLLLRCLSRSLSLSLSFSLSRSLSLSRSRSLGFLDRGLVERLLLLERLCRCPSLAILDKS